MRVLVVEDEERLALGIQRGLEAEGFAVDVALDGDDGLWRAREHPYDAIVLDIMLPGTNGYRICSALRDSLCVVVSQDGGVRFVRWDDGRVTYWDQVAASAFG